MKKLKISADGYIIGTVIFWLVFIAMVICNSILTPALKLDDKQIIGMTASSFVGIFLLLGLFIGIVLMMNFSCLLLAWSKYASSANYKAEARWSISVFALNLVFTAIFIVWFVIKVLMSDGVAALFNNGSYILDDKDLITSSFYTLKLSYLMNYFAVCGLVFGIIAFSLSIAISNRTNNVVKKIKEYERVNIY